jgi:hypothetical protein
MKISTFISGVAALMMLAIGAAAQCPQISVTGPSDARTVGETVTLSGLVMGGKELIKPSYNWTVSAGKIVKGAGTPQIEVDPTGLGDAASLTATLDVIGFSPSCNSMASATVDFKKGVAAVKTDEYPTNLKAKDEEPRLKKVVDTLRADPTGVVYVIAYSSKKSKPGEAAAALQRASEYMQNMRGVSSDQIKLIEGGDRPAGVIEFWIGPYDATAPKATPPKP